MLAKLAPYQSGLIFLAIACGFVALLLSDLGGSKQFECSLCIEFQGRTECTAGRGATRDDAVQSAQTVACAGLAGGPNESFRCSATPPRSLACQEL